MNQQPPLYQIVDWNKHFENSKSRQRGRCGFVCLPNRQGGLGFRSIMAEPDGRAIYGAWCALLAYLSRQENPREGWLTLDGKEKGTRLTAADLARLWGAPTTEIYRVFQVTTRPDIAWIRLVDGEHEWHQQLLDGQSVTADGHSTVTARSVSDREQVPENQSKLTVTARSLGGQSVTQEKNRREECIPYLTLHNTSTALHNITVRRGGLDNPQKTEQEIPWINALFQNPEPWSYEELRLLSELLPIRPESKRLLIWAHNIPPENPFHQMTKLKQSRLFMLREYGAELDKIRSARRQMGLNGELAPEKK